MSIDWSCAPAEATHYCIGDDLNPWRKIVGTTVYALNRKKWVMWSSFNEGYMPAYYAPIPLETWDGQGLPPVGTTCIVEPHNTLWGFSSTSGHERKILAYHTDYVWLGNGDTPLETTRIDKVDFRPIHTPEQIAAEEREKAINQMISDAGYVDPKIGTFVAMGNLYDAGYRRQESST